MQRTWTSGREGPLNDEYESLVVATNTFIRKEDIAPNSSLSSDHAREQNCGRQIHMHTSAKRSSLLVKVRAWGESKELKEPTGFL